MSGLPSLINQPLAKTTTLGGLIEGTQFYYTNHLGSIALVTDESGQPVMRLRHEPPRWTPKTGH